MTETLPRRRFYEPMPDGSSNAVLTCDVCQYLARYNVPTPLLVEVLPSDYAALKLFLPD